METTGKAKSEVKNLENELADIIKQVEEKKKQSLYLSTELMEMQWKIEKAEFVKYFEEQERIKYRTKMKEVVNGINTEEGSAAGLEADHEENKRVLQDLIMSRDNLIKKIENLNGANVKLVRGIEELQNSVSILKKRNAAMKIKLKKQKEEYDKKIQLRTCFKYDSD